MDAETPTPDSAQASSTQRNLLTCQVHGLRYDPSMIEGCVLCRRAVAPPEEIGRYTWRELAMVAVLLVAGGAGGTFSWKHLTSGPTLMTHAEMASGSSSLRARCDATCATTHDACGAACRAKPGDAACPDYCFGELDKCFRDCAARFMTPELPWSYHYGTRGMPAWSAILQRSVGVRERLLQCSDEPLSVLAQVGVAEEGGAPVELAVWNHDMSAGVLACASQVLRGMSLPPGPDGDYRFVARFDSRYDDLRLVLAETEQEIGALERLRAGDAGEEIKARLFDTKVLIAQQGASPPAPQIAQLAEVKSRVERLNQSLAALQRANRSQRQPVIDDERDRQVRQVVAPRGDAARAAALKRELEERERRDRKTREETEHYRRLNREAREEERRIERDRAWKNYLENQR